MQVTCGSCGRKKPEPDMGIYDVFTDTYFCNQGCKNKKDGIKRDKDGCVVTEK
ncbi:hypothetical protein LCGC14_2764340 [marine sediment metagenome]|uniref:MYM-type domain-containing protein n=1 Tax=marine sediment metagenome TaxID=412755 RepID=A0A0F9B6N1_9ZZZZ